MPSVSDLVALGNHSYVGGVPRGAAFPVRAVDATRLFATFSALLLGGCSLFMPLSEFVVNPMPGSPLTRCFGAPLRYDVYRCVEAALAASGGEPLGRFLSAQGMQCNASGPTSACSVTLIVRARGMSDSNFTRLVTSQVTIQQIVPNFCEISIRTRAVETPSGREFFNSEIQNPEYRSLPRSPRVACGNFQGKEII
jgi:hypothetical protein